MLANGFSTLGVPRMNDNLSFEAVSTIYKKYTNKYKEKIVDRDHMYM